MVAWAGVELFCRGVSSPLYGSAAGPKNTDHHTNSNSNSNSKKATLDHPSYTPAGEEEHELLEPIPRWTLGPHVNRNNDVVFRKRVKQS
jgi:hypothetical protein